MITEPEKFNIKTIKGEPMSIEINWRPEDEETNNCKVLRIRIGDKETFMATGDLRTILFAVSNKEEQKKMMPLQMITQRKWSTVLGLKAYKDIKKGEVVNFKVDIPLPPIEEEIMYQANQIVKNRLVVPEKNSIIRN